MTQNCRNGINPSREIPRLECCPEMLRKHEQENIIDLYIAFDRGINKDAHALCGLRADQKGKTVWVVIATPDGTIFQLFVGDSYQDCMPVVNDVMRHDCPLFILEINTAPVQSIESIGVIRRRMRAC